MGMFWLIISLDAAGAGRQGAAWKKLSLLSFLEAALQFSHGLMGTHINVPRLYHIGLLLSLGEGSCPSPAPAEAGGEEVV